MSKKRALRYEQLRSEKGISWSRQYIRRLEKAGQFPNHFNLGPGTIAWLESDIDAWLDERIAESREHEVAEACMRNPGGAGMAPGPGKNQSHGRESNPGTAPTQDHGRASAVGIPLARERWS